MKIFLTATGGGGNAKAGELKQTKLALSAVAPSI